MIFLMFGLGLEFSCKAGGGGGPGAFIRRHPGGGHGGVGVLLGLAWAGAP